MADMLVSIAGHLSFGLTAVSFYVRDMILLRAIAIVSGIVGIGYNFYLDSGPLWLPIFWISAFICINAFRIAGIIVEHRSVNLSEDELELYETEFQDFSPVEFMKLMRIAEWRSADVGHVFAQQGHEIEGLKLLFNGKVVVERDGEEVGTGQDGSMIGEMSFIQGGAATATVSATNPCRYVYWPKEQLKRLLKRNPNMDIAMKHVFSMELTRKLAGTVSSMKI